MSQVEEAAVKATFVLQYSSRKAATFVVGEVPTATFEQALEVVNRVVRHQKR